MNVRSVKHEPSLSIPLSYKLILETLQLNIQITSKNYFFMLIVEKFAKNTS